LSLLKTFPASAPETERAGLVNPEWMNDVKALNLAGNTEGRVGAGPAGRPGDDLNVVAVVESADVDVDCVADCGSYGRERALQGPDWRGRRRGRGAGRSR